MNPITRYNQPIEDLNPQPLPPGRALNPQPLPPGLLPSVVLPA
jgi:hypothetical protein